MKINWKVRMRNKVWVMTFIAGLLAVLYEALALFGVTPKVEQAQLMRLTEMLVGVLVLLGVIVDPTTPGTQDSDLAMTYGRKDDIDEAAICKGLKNAEILDDIEYAEPLAGPDTEGNKEV